MKPTLLANRKARSRDLFESRRNSCRFPIIDFNYHSVPLGNSSAKYGSVPVRSFWNIAGDYFKNEARPDLLGEASLFGVIVVTAFLPLISNAHALMEFVRAIGNY